MDPVKTLDDLPGWVALWTVVVLVLPVLLLPVLSALLDRSGHIRLHHWAEEAGGRLRALQSNPARFEAFRFLLSVGGRAALLTLLGSLWLLLRDQGVLRGGVAAFGGLLAFVFLQEAVIRWLTEVHTEAALERMTPIYRFLLSALLPLVWLLQGRIAFEDEEDSGAEDEEEATEGEIQAYIDVGRREGILEPEEEELLLSIVDFGDSRVRSVMTPRVEIVAADVDQSLEQMAEIFFKSKHARLPVYRDSIDHILGIVHIRDLFEAIHHGGGQAAESLAKPPTFVPESKSLRDLLGELQALHQQMAIVVDEYGGVAGLVTVEDLVEEIVGEIADEHEEEDPLKEPLSDGGWRLSGRTDLEEIEELYDVDLGHIEWETLSGLICGDLGYVPPVGECVVLHGLEMRVDAADDRRVTSVAVWREVRESGTPGDESGRASRVDRVKDEES